MRITFDSSVAFRDYALDLSVSAPNTALTGPNERLMEIKTNGVYPLWLSRLLWEADARRVHFSKYGLAYTRFMMPGCGVYGEEKKHA